MGNYFTSERQVTDRMAPKKRKRNSEDDDNVNESKDHEKKLLQTPRRKKLRTTSKYIYDTFFVNGTNSDVTISALDHKWKLHKVYLKQSGYFSSMLSGAWRESDQNDIEILIPDKNIDKEALDISFGSLYQDDVSIKPCRVVSVLAAANLLQLDSLIQHCAETMEETISAHTVCSYHQASLLYGLPNTTKSCKTWLERNVMTAPNPGLLKEIGAELMSEIVSSSDLFVMQVEMDVYSMLKKWLFLQLSPNWPGLNKQLSDAAETFLSKDENKRVLQVEANRALLDVFRNVRLRHIINDVHSANILLSDGLIPKAGYNHFQIAPESRDDRIDAILVANGHSIVYPMMVDYFFRPTDQLDQDVFLRESLRCGRVLLNDGEYCWRWTGFNYGTDLLVTYAHRLIIVKRNTQTHSYPLSVSLEPKRSVMLRCTVVSFDRSGRPKYTKCSGTMTLSLGREGEAIILCIDRTAKFPLHVSMNLLFYTPDARLRDVCTVDEQTLESRSVSMANERLRSLDESESKDDIELNESTDTPSSSCSNSTSKSRTGDNPVYLDISNHSHNDASHSGEASNQADGELDNASRQLSHYDLEVSANYSDDDET